MRRLLPVFAVVVACAGCQGVSDVFGTAAPPGQPGNGPIISPGGRPQIVLDSIRVAPGGTGTLQARLRGGGRVAGTQNDILFDPAVVTIARTGNGRPDCTANAALGKEGTAFSFQPAGCSGERCTGVRALVLSLSNVSPIPTGSVLYSCTVRASDTAQGSSRLRITRVGFSDPAGAAISGGGVDGRVTIAK